MESTEQVRTDELSRGIGSGAYNVLQVAFALGYEDEPEEQS